MFIAWIVGKDEPVSVYEDTIDDLTFDDLSLSDADIDDIYANGFYDGTESIIDDCIDHLDYGHDSHEYYN